MKANSNGLNIRKIRIAEKKSNLQGFIKEL